MMGAKLIGLATILLLSVASVQAETCHTELIPFPTTPSLGIVLQPGVNYPVWYPKPPGISVTLEFWGHLMPSQPTIWLAWYLSTPSGPNRMGVALNTTEGYRAQNFALSTVMNDGDIFVVSAVNSTGAPVEIYLGILLRECP